MLMRLAPCLSGGTRQRSVAHATQADITFDRGIVLAFKDPKTYVLALGYHGITGAAGFQNFFPTLTKTLGYGNIPSLLLCAPPYVMLSA